MNMKRNVIYLLFVAAIAACSPDVDIPLQLGSEDIHVGPEGGVRTIEINVGEPWTAMTNEPWVAISPANGKGSELCQVMIDSTLVNDVREDVVRIQTASGQYKEFAVVQDGFPHQISVRKPVIEIKDFDVLDKRKFEVVVSTNVDFDVQIPAEHSWLTCEKPEAEEMETLLDRGARPRNVTLKFKWNVNPTSSERAPEINLVASAEGLEDVMSAITVRQGAAPDIQGYVDAGDLVAADSLALLSISRFLGCWSEYDTGLRMARWDGVTLHKSGKNKGRVKSAQFVFFETNEALPYAVKYLTAAEELYFFSNVNSFQKSLSLGEDICELENLKKLTMFSYGLTELPSKIKNMKSLRYLDLGGNNFASIPKELRECESLKALFLTSNQRGVIMDLSNTVKKDIGGLVDECPADGSGNRQFPQWLLEWEQLDTLRLSVNYLQGTLPSDQELLDKGFKAWDVDSFDSSVTEVHLADSLGEAGKKYFKENRIPMVLPNTDFLSINLNRLSGDIPKWLKFHPKLDYWTPLLLVFPQEGKDMNGTAAGFKDVPTNLNYYYEIYSEKKWSDINVEK